jgi:hypothetical protein
VQCSGEGARNEQGGNDGKCTFHSLQE